MLNDYGFPLSTVVGSADGFDPYPRTDGKIVSDCPCGGGMDGGSISYRKTKIVGGMMHMTVLLDEIEDRNIQV